MYRASIAEGDINLDAAISVLNEHPYFTCTSSTCNFDKIELHFSGHWDDWLYKYVLCQCSASVSLFLGGVSSFLCAV